VILLDVVNIVIMRQLRMFQHEDLAYMIHGCYQYFFLNLILLTDKCIIEITCF